MQIKSLFYNLIHNARSTIELIRFRFSHIFQFSSFFPLFYVLCFRLQLHFHSFISMLFFSSLFLVSFSNRSKRLTLTAE